MLVSDIAVAVAAIAFLITQVHLYRVAKKLIRKSNESWSRAHGEISQVKSDVLAEIKRFTEKGGEGQLDSRIQELETRLTQSFSQFNEHVAQVFTSFGSTLGKDLDAKFSAITSPPLLRSGVSPTEAQLEGAASKQAKKIVQAIKAEALSPEISQLDQFLRAIGQEDLADRMMENPAIVNMVLRQINADQWLRGRLGQFMGGARGAPQGNHPGGPI